MQIDVRATMKKLIQKANKICDLQTKIEYYEEAIWICNNNHEKAQIHSKVSNLYTTLDRPAKALQHANHAICENREDVKVSLRSGGRK